MTQNPETLPAVQASTQTALTPAQIEVIKTTLAPGLTDDELKLFLIYVLRTGLDPFRREIYAVKRYSKNDKGEWEGRMVIHAGIDGLRSLAQETGLYDTQVGPYWCGPDGEWKDVWLSPEPPAAAKVGVVRRGSTAPIWAIARWATYRQTTRTGEVTHFWKDMPDLMLAKCAEALALRRAFPRQLSGLYVPEEMSSQATLPPPTPNERKQSLQPPTLRKSGQSIAVPDGFTECGHLTQAAFNRWKLFPQVVAQKLGFQNITDLSTDPESLKVYWWQLVEIMEPTEPPPTEAPREQLL